MKNITKFGIWIKREGLTLAEVGRRIKKSKSTVYKYTTGEARPQDDLTMKLIFQTTNGEVTPNDFYDINLDGCGKLNG